MTDDTKIASLLNWGITQQYHAKSETHLPKGLSSHYACPLKQVIRKFIPRDPRAVGAMLRGSRAHARFYEYFPVGARVWEYAVLGHEQLVYLDIKKANGDVSHYQSWIDVVVRKEDGHIEVWDIKNTQSFNFVKDDPVYVHQLNLYAFLYEGMIGLSSKTPYEPMMCRIVAQSATDDTNLCVVSSWAMDSEMACESISRIALVEETVEIMKRRIIRVEKEAESVGKDIIADFHDVITKEEALELATGLSNWHTKVREPYRKECKYCLWKSDCVKACGLPADFDHDRGKLE